MIQRLDWDSNFFGFAIGEVDPTSLVPGRLAGEAQAGGYRCLYYRCAIGDARALQKAAEAAFAVVDVRVTLEMVVGTGPSGQRRLRPDVAVGMFTDTDAPALARIARQLSRYSRFAFDARFGPEQAERLYAEWLRVSWAGRADAFLVARLGGDPVGFATCRLFPERARLELVAVDEVHAGRGVGTALLASAQDWLAANGARIVTVVTQGRNPAAITFYGRCGFRLSDIALVHHRWF